jgi:DNA polymerase III gamma/tau subunit
METSVEQKFASPIIYYGADYATSLNKAKNFIQELIGKSENHPDLLEFKLDGKNYTKEQITDFLSDIALAPYQSSHKIYLFHNADKMLAVHANALLKTFEEKPDHAIILLVTDNIKAIIETILSRSRKVFAPSSEEEKKVYITPILEGALNSIFDGKIYNALDRIPELESFDVHEITHIITNFCRDIYVKQLSLDNVYLNNQAIETLSIKNNIDLEKISKLLEKAELAHERYMKPKVILEYIFLSIYNEIN